MNKSKINLTAVMNVAGLERKQELEKMMKSGDYAPCLVQEITHLYFINNLRLITLQN